jgi:hypothetical protein
MNVWSENVHIGGGTNIIYAILGGKCSANDKCGVFISSSKYRSAHIGLSVSF